MEWELDRITSGSNPSAENPRKASELIQSWLIRSLLSSCLCCLRRLCVVLVLREMDCNVHPHCTFYGRKIAYSLLAGVGGYNIQVGMIGVIVILIAGIAADF